MSAPLAHRVLDRHPGGRRGALMMVLGGFWVLFAAGIMSGTSTPDPSAGLLHLWIPAPVRAGVWAVTGALAVVTSTRSRWHRWGLIGLVIMPTIRAASYAWAWVTYWLPDADPGLAGGWYGAGFWAQCVFLVAVVAGVPPTGRRHP